MVLPPRWWVWEARHPRATSSFRLRSQAATSFTRLRTFVLLKNWGGGIAHSELSGFTSSTSDSVASTTAAAAGEGASDNDPSDDGAPDGDDADADQAARTDQSDPYKDDAYEDAAKAPAVTSITIPATVTTIDAAFFQLFPNATAIDVADDNPSFTSHNGMLFGMNDAEDPTDLHLVPEGLEGNAVLPDSLASVPAYVFSRCNKLLAISFSGSTNATFAIRNGILYTNDLTIALAAPAGLGSSASLADACTSIGEGAFWGNAALETIVVSSDVADIAATAFSDKAVQNATVALTGNYSRAAWEAAGFTSFAEPAKPGTETVTESGLAYTLLDDYTLAVHWAGDEAASGYLEVPAQADINGTSYPVSTVAEGAFEGAADLTQIGLPETLTSIGARAFANTGLAYMYVPANVTSIGDGAFQGCAQMRSVNLNSTLAVIGAHAFDGCAHVQYFVLPATVQSIGAYAMAGIDDLKNIVALGSVASVDPAALVGVSGANIYVPYAESGEYAWSMGAPVANNHLMPYGVKVAADPVSIAVDESTSLFEGGWLEAPGGIQVNYSYKAKPMSIDADGTVTGKAEGASAIAVSLTLSLGEAEAVSQVQPEGEGSMSVLRAVRSVGATGSMTYTLGTAAGAARVNATTIVSPEDGIAPQANENLTIHSNVPANVSNGDWNTGICAAPGVVPMGEDNQISVSEFGVHFASVGWYKDRDNNHLRLFGLDSSLNKRFVGALYVNPADSSYTQAGFYIDPEYTTPLDNTSDENTVQDIYVRFTKLTIHSNVPANVSNGDWNTGICAAPGVVPMGEDNQISVSEFGVHFASVGWYKDRDNNHLRLFGLDSSLNKRFVGALYVNPADSSYTQAGFYIDPEYTTPLDNTSDENTVQDIYVRFTKLTIHSNVPANVSNGDWNTGICAAPGVVPMGEDNQISVSEFGVHIDKFGGYSGANNNNNHLRLFAFASDMSSSYLGALHIYPIDNRHVFAGFYLDPGYTEKLQYSEETVNPEFDIYRIQDVYVKFVFAAATVSYMSDGAVHATQSVGIGYTTTPPATPVKAGYNFVSWCTDAAGTLPFDFTSPVFNDLTLYAKWDLISYQITYADRATGIFNSATWPSVGMVTVESADITLPKSTDPGVRQRQGHTLVGWKAATNGEAVYTDTVSIKTLIEAGNADSNNVIALAAQWIENTYDITFAGGKGDPQGLPAAIQNVPYASASITITGANPTNFGYEFVGYTGPNDVAVVSGTTKIADVLNSTDFPADGSTIVLTANWELRIYTISFANMNDVDGDALLGAPDMTDVPMAGVGTVTTDIEKARSNDKTAIFLNDPTLTGYTFGGFAGGTTTATYMKGNVIDEAVFESLFGVDGATRAVTLNGVWTAKDYVIEYHSNYQDANQTDAISTATVNYKDTFAAPDAATIGFSKLGYACSGWLDAAAGVSIGTPASVRDLVAKMGDNSPIKLYVQWTAGENKFVVKYYWQDPATGDYVEGTSRTVTQVNGHNLLTGDVVNLKDGLLGSETASELQGYYLDHVTGRSDYSYDATTYTDHSVDYLYDLNADKGSATTITLPEDGSGQFEVYYDVLGKVVFTGDAYTNDAMPLDALTHVKYGQASQALGDLAFDKLNDSGKTWVSFKAWSDASGNEYAAGATPIVTTNVVLHPVWDKNVYTVEYAEKAGQEGRVSTNLTAADSSFITTFTEDDFGPNKDQVKSLNTANANTGYTWNGWDAADDSDIPNISLSASGTFVTLFPHAVSGNEADRVATVYADMSANAYRINFIKYIGGSDGLGITPISFTLDDASIVLPGNTAVADDQRMYGYSLRDWRVGNTAETPAFIGNMGATLDNAALKRLIEAASTDGGDIDPDTDNVRIISMYAGWTAMYSVTVPDNSRVLFDIDVSNMPSDKTYTAGDQPISVTSKTPMPITVGAISAKTDTASNVFGSAVDQVRLTYDGVEFDLDGGTPSFGTTVAASTATNEQTLSGPLSMTLNDAVVGEMLAKLEQNQSNQLAATNVAKITWLVDMVDVDNGTGGVKPDDETQVWVFSDAVTKTLVSALDQITQALDN